MDSCLLENLVKTRIVDELNNIFVDLGGGITKAKFSAVETPASNEQELTTFLIGSKISSVHVTKTVFMLEDTNDTSRGEEFSTRGIQAPPPTARQLKQIDKVANIQRLRKENIDKVANNERLRIEKIAIIKKYEQEMRMRGNLGSS